MSYEYLGGWRVDGACNNLSNEEKDRFFADKGPLRSWAKKFCHDSGCPVLSKCLEDAFKRKDFDGVLGGMAGNERRVVVNSGKQLKEEEQKKSA